MAKLYLLYVQVFKSKNDFLDWTSTQGKKDNIVIIIKRSDAGEVD